MPRSYAYYYSYVPEVRSLNGWTEPSEWTTTRRAPSEFVTDNTYKLT